MLNPTYRRRPATAVLVLAMAVSATACESNKNTSPGSHPNTAAPMASAPAEPSTAEPEPAHDDSEIADQVTQALLFDRAVARANLDVSVIDGIVSLSGKVGSLLAKERATRIAEAVRGVRAVSNRLVVDTPKVADDTLVERVKSALIIDPAAKSYEVNVDAHQGEITLTGHVDSWAEHMLVERLAASVTGVTEVTNRVIVQYPASRTDEEILNDVEARLRWDVLVDNALIEVLVDDGTVRLLGSVGSAAEKRRAITDAHLNGVDEVDADELKVEPWLDDQDRRASKYTSVSDEDIRSALLEAAAYDPRLLSFDIAPKVDDGVVTLYGQVPTLEAKRAAVQLARDTVGVIRVSDRLEIAPPTPVQDEKIEDDVETALALNPYTGSHPIGVSVSHGLARLTGSVDSPLEKAEAEWVASRVVGVRDVDDDLKVTIPGAAYVYEPWVRSYSPLIGDWDFDRRGNAEPMPSDAELQHAVEEHLFWEPYASQWQIAVSAHDGKVTLEGVVDSWTERASAAAAAYQAGALAVDNQLTVDPT